MASRFISLEAVKLEADHNFTWLPPSMIERLRHFTKQSTNARLYAFVTLSEGVTDPFNIGHGTRLFTEDERKRMARTAIGTSLNINHKYGALHGLNQVVDAEYIDDVKGIAGIAYVEDPRVNELYDAGLITGPSIEFGSRYQLCEDERSDGIKSRCHQYGANIVGLALLTKPELPGDLRSKFYHVESLMEQDGERPPDSWFEACKSRMVGEVDNVHAFCTWLWNNGTSAQRAAFEVLVGFKTEDIHLCIKELVDRGLSEDEARKRCAAEEFVRLFTETETVAAKASARRACLKDALLSHRVTLDGVEAKNTMALDEATKTEIRGLMTNVLKEHEAPCTQERAKLTERIDNVDKLVTGLVSSIDAMKASVEALTKASGTGIRAGSIQTQGIEALNDIERKLLIKKRIESAPLRELMIAYGWVPKVSS